MRFAIVDGSDRDEHAASVSVFDRGFLLGDSVLETMRTYQGKVFALDAHLDRLDRSLRALGIDAPCPRATLREEVARVVARMNHEPCAVRIVISRGQGPAGLDPTGADRPFRAVLAEPLLSPSDDAYRRGIRVLCVRTLRASDVARGAKVSNYLAAILATRAAKAAGADEALIVNADGQVVEGATGNVFAVLGGTLATPQVGDEVLDGITRGVVLNLARTLRIPILERALSIEELTGANEVFVTSSLRELMAVAEIDGRRVANAPGPVTRALHRAFRRHVGAPPPAYTEALTP